MNEAHKIELENKKKEISAEIERLSQITDFGDDVDSGEEEADEYEEYGNQLSVIETLRNRLADINLALQNIEEGKYGICEKCGGVISEEVLNVAPESRLCQNCK